MGAAFAGIAARVSGMIGGPYVSATLHRITQARATGGDITETITDVPCQAQVDRVTEAMRADPRYTEAEVRILVLSATLAGEVTSDYRITVGGPLAGTYKLTAPIGRDPMGITWEAAGVGA